MTKPRIVRIIARLNVGGPALHATYLSEGLSDRFDTTLITGVIGEDEADLSDLARARGVRLEVLPRLGREIHPWNDLLVLISLVRILRRERPVIVHTHTAKAGTVGRMAAVLAGVPVRVHTFHGHVLRGYFGKLKTRAFVQVERFLGRFTTTVIAISASQADELIDDFRVATRDQVRVIPLGLELDRFAAENAAERRGAFRAEVGAGDRVVISCIGRLVPIKNHRLLVEAFGRLIAEGSRALLVIVGGGSEEKPLRDLVNEMGLSDHVAFLGWRSDLDMILAGSDVVALSSINEGTPVSLIEAMTAGCAVVSTDVGGVRDVLENGELGLLVPSNDAPALADAMRRLVEDSALRRELGRRGAQSAPARFGVRRLLTDVAALYDELLKDSSAHSSKTSKVLAAD